MQGFERGRLIARLTQAGQFEWERNHDRLDCCPDDLARLGGESFVATSGATGLAGSADSLTFMPGRNPKRVTHVRVTVTHDGLYDLTFFTMGKGPQSYDGIHGEMLKKSSTPIPGSRGTSGVGLNAARPHLRFACRRRTGPGSSMARPTARHVCADVRFRREELRSDIRAELFRL